MTDPVRELLAGTETQIAEILAATPEQHTTDGIRRPQPGSRPPCDLDRIDRLTAELDQVRYWSSRWGYPGGGTVGNRIRHLLDTYEQQNPDELRRILEHWGPIRKANRSRWPTDHKTPDVWWSRQEAAEHLNRNERIIRRWAEANPSIARIDEEGRPLFNASRLIELDERTPRRVSPPV